MQHHRGCTGLQKEHPFRDKVVIKEAGPSKRTILIVDDGPSILLVLLSQRLCLGAFDCGSCSSGEEALELMRQQAFDVVISDSGMPGISGLELLEQARSAQSARPIANKDFLARKNNP